MKKYPQINITMPKNPGDDATEDQKQEYKRLRDAAYGEFYPRALNMIEGFV